MAACRVPLNSRAADNHQSGGVPAPYEGCSELRRWIIPVLGSDISIIYLLQYIVTTGQQQQSALVAVVCTMVRLPSYSLHINICWPLVGGASPHLHCPHCILHILHITAAQIINIYMDFITSGQIESKEASEWEYVQFNDPLPPSARHRATGHWAAPTLLTGGTRRRIVKTFLLKFQFSSELNCR